MNSPDGRPIAVDVFCRHRYFEAGGWTLEQPDHPEHAAPQTKMGRAPRDGEFVQAIGNFSGVALVRDDWGVPWMNRDGIRESIPPAYARHVAGQFTAQRTTPPLLAVLPAPA